jgi:hypothetical protein
MKSLILIAILSTLLIGCGDSKTIDNIEVPTYGMYNESDLKCENIRYSIVGQNIFWMIVSGASVVPPFLFGAFELWEPEGKIDTTKPINCK